MHLIRLPIDDGRRYLYLRHFVSVIGLDIEIDIISRLIESRFDARARDDVTSRLVEDGRNHLVAWCCWTEKSEGLTNLSDG